MADKPTYEELEQRIRELEQVESERKRAEQTLHRTAIPLRSFAAGELGPS